jgi:S-adenosylmethionine:tRNA ribosyltransferase-isomerase
MEPRDHARLMCVNRKKQELTHRHFYDIVDLLEAGDVLVWNDSKVFKARLFGTLVGPDNAPLVEHTKPIEIFLVRPMENAGVWKVLAKPGKHVRAGARIKFAEDFFCDALIKQEEGTILVQFEDDDETVRAKANRVGSVPLPPYIKDEKHELEAYQTVYADQEGSVAAPTAGLHFTPELIERLREKGVLFASVCLHVGLGTFLPVKTEYIEDHTMHSEWAELTVEDAEKIQQAKKQGGRIVAVGTTTARTLEGIAELHDGSVAPYRGDIDIFIQPGFDFSVVDALITNFHLPKSTLLMLVAAFAGGTAFVLRAYEEAVKEEYRFYSFGDAMFIY